MTAFAPLATLADLDSFNVAYQGRENLAASLLASVSDAVRAAAGSPISLGTYTVDIPSESSRRLDLPCRPVTKVSSVVMGGEPVDDWTLVGNALYRPAMWTMPGDIPVNVTCTFTAGYTQIPKDIIRLVCSMVSAGLQQDSDGGPGSHRGVAYERIDDGQVGYMQGADEVIDATELPKSTRDMLYARFGMPGISIGVFR